MSYKFYVTDWIPELGRYAIIISTRKDDRNLAAETFVFALDSDPFFGGRRLTYAYNEDIKPPIDEEFMHKMALDQAKGIISLQKEEAYRRTKNLDIYRRDFEQHIVEPRFILLGEIRQKYEDKLKELSMESWVKDLKEVLSAFLKLVIKVEPFKTK